MAIVRPEELRDMTPAERRAELEELETQLLHANAQKAVGGAPENAGRIKELRRAIARIKTIQREEGDVPGDAGGVGPEGDSPPADQSPEETGNDVGEQ